MPIIEIRRHSMRGKPGSHLTQAGLDLARRVGQGMGPFCRVITSEKVRAIETAVAMGFAVTEEWSFISELSPGFEDEVLWDAGFAPIGEALLRGGKAAAYGRTLEAELQHLVMEMPPDGVSLIISHGGIVEAAAMACFPKGKYAGMKDPCSFCEGVRLRFSRGGWVSGEFLPVSA
ncbi:MAG: histidine phosphatase family protein [Candidatus Ozemobacteraceae bacterium]